MRDELSAFEWTAIKPMLPNKTRGARRRLTRASASIGSGCARRRLALNGVM
jgi:hypothetical protein